MLRQKNPGCWVSAGMDVKLTKMTKLSCRGTLRDKVEVSS